MGKCESKRVWGRLLCVGALTTAAIGGCGSDAEDSVDPATAPIEAPDAEWTWVDFPGTRCMDDSATGLGIRMNEASDKLVIVIQGGGACFNTSTCGLVANANGFGENNLHAAVGAGFLDPEDEDNPFRDWNMVFIPYCSGDIFSGTAVDGSGFGGRTQAGYLNMQEYLARLVPTFADASRVVLGGFSAGGFAASINWIQAIDAWGPDVRIDVLNDSGPPLGEKYMPPCFQQRLAEVWNWSANVPEECTECDIEGGHVTEPVMRWSVSRTKQFRHALISSTEDGVMKIFNGYGVDDCSGLDGLFPGTFPDGMYGEGLLDLQNNIFGDHPGARAFIMEGNSHATTATMSPGAIESEGVVLRDWVEDFLDPDAEWETVSPL